MGKKINVQGSVASENIWGEKSQDKVFGKGDVNLIEIANWLWENQKSEMLKLLIRDKENKWGLKEKLFGHRQSILAHLKQNCVEIEDVEMMWIKWKSICIELPAVWKFKWYKFEFFVSNNIISKRGINNVNMWNMLNDVRFERGEIVDFLLALNEYFNEYWVNLDEESHLKKIKEIPVDNRGWFGSVPSGITSIFNEITWQKNKWYILKDSIPVKEDDPFNSIEWNCDFNSDCGLWFLKGANGYGLFKLSKSS